MISFKVNNKGTKAIMSNDVFLVSLLIILNIFIRGVFRTMLNV